MKEQKLKRGQRPENWKEDCPKFKEYYAKRNPDWSDKQCQEESKKFCRSCNWQCIEYYQKHHPDKSIEECEELRKTAIKKSRENKQQYIEYYELRYSELTHEERLEMLNKYNAENNYQKIEYYQKRFPDATPEEHKQMLIRAKNDYLSKRPDISGENNPHHHSNTTLEERRISSPKCIDFYQKRFPDATPEEHEQMLKEHYKYVASKLTPDKYTTKIEYYLSKGYDEETSIKMLKQRQSTNTLEKFINRYGDVGGNIKFEQRQEKWKKSLNNHFLKNGDSRSPQSTFAINLITDICNRLELKYPKKEKFMTDKLGNHFAYDLCINKKIIEFNGDYWHCNPNIYNENFFNKSKQMTAKQIWDLDDKKRKCAEENGYKILYIWEDEYNNSPKNTLKKCIDFLIS